MQTTLLGLAIAFIIALAAALVGPFFIDWNQFRPQFEAEASRILGTPVRVAGALDARLLPAPSLRLRDVQVGGANDLGKVRAEQLDVELSLGSLMRGELRATELTINGAAVDLGLDANGRVDWPATSGAYNLGTLAIDRVNLTGRIVLHDAASRGTIEFDDLAFSGDVRALAGSIRGDGNFRLAGARYPFRVSSGPGLGNVGTRLHLTIDPAEVPLSIDLDGLLTFDNRAPRFDGALVLARPLPPRYVTDPPPPWRVTAKLKVDPATAMLDQLEASYGADETALKLAGNAGLRFGVMPQLQATLATKSIDADRLLGPDATPGGLLSDLRDALAQGPALPMPARINLAADQIIVGGKPVQNVIADLSSDGMTWRLDKLDARAPGATRVTLAGVAAQTTTAGFKGALTLDSAEPDVFAAWLQRRDETKLRAQKPLRLSGQLDVAADRIALDDIRGEIDGSPVDGRLALAFPDASPSRAELRLKADRLDIDAVVALARSLAGPDTKWPDEARLSLDIGRAISAGQEMRPFGLDLRYGRQTMALDRLRVGEATGVMLDGSGAFDRLSSTGQFNLAAASASMAQVGGLIAPFAPDVAARLAAMPAAAGPVKLKLALTTAKNDAQPDRASLTTTLTLDGAQLAGTASITATPPLTAFRTLDLDALRRSDMAVAMKLSSPQGRNLVALLALDSIIGVETGAMQLEATLNGAWTAPLRLTAKLSGPAIDADMHGTAEPFAEPRKAALSLAVRRVSVAPALAMKPNDPRASVTNLTSRLSVVGDRVSFDGFDGAIAGARLRGKAAVTWAEPKTIDGDIGLDALELAPLFNLAIGSAHANPAEPLSRGLVQGWRGRLAFQALRGALPGGIELRPVGGTIKSDGQSLTFDAIKGGLGGGEVTADIDARPGLSGLVLNARLGIANVEGAALRYRALALPGRATLKMTLTSQGRSAEALAGALSGDGLLTLVDAKIPALDPRAFDAALRASDEGRVRDDARLTQIVQSALNAGTFDVGSAQFGVAIKDGNLRVGATTLEGDGARVIVSGGYDIAADQADIRAIMSSTSVGSGTSRPEIRLFAAGTPDRLNRTLDVASLSTWLAVRAIDRETRRLDQLERETMPVTSGPVAPGPALPVPTAPRPAATVPDDHAPAETPRALPPPRPRIVAPRPVAPIVPAPSASSQLVPL
ncbi:MAG: hypothetical protein JWR73_1404, partial [Tardiphaga sp.]|nr:hypothetical protein [Tardiphaga sp.]